MAAPAVKWTNEEYDIVAKAALALPEGASRTEMLRQGQKALPKDRQKVIPDHLGGKSFQGFQAAMARVQGQSKKEQQRSAATKARSRMSELRKSLHGQGERIAAAMKRADKSDADVAAATGVHLHSIRMVLRDRTKTMMDKNIARVATYLGANYGQLRAGIDAEMPEQFAVVAVADNQPDRSGGEPSQLIPHAGTVFKANGKHHPKSHEGRVEHAMGTNIDTTILALWSLLPMDAKVMVIARVAELVAMQAKH